MTELFKAKPGSSFSLEGVGPDQLLERADDLLQEDLFRCFGLHPRTELSIRAAQLIAGIGGLSIPFERPLTIASDDEVSTVLGMDVVRGKAGSDDGTSYRRPVAENAKRPDNDALTGKNFAYVPLGGPVTITGPSQREFPVEPGEGFLAVEGETYSIHVPAGQVSVEFVIAPGEDHNPAEWNRYVNEQPNPTT